MSAVLLVFVSGYGVGSASVPPVVAMQEFATVEACKAAGDWFLKFRNNNEHRISAICVPKG